MRTYIEHHAVSNRAEKTHENGDNDFISGPISISHRKRVAQLCSQALGSLFVASYDSQVYGGGIRTRFYTGHSSIIHPFNAI
jgi:hypothetical protein